MTIYLRQSTASQEVPLGRFVDSVDGNTQETGLTIANTDIKIWKTGATTLANKNSGGATHIANGVYYAVLDATDTDTLGPLVIFVHVSGALDVKLECVVLAANIYDSLIAASDKLQADLQEWIGVAPLALSSQRVQTLVAAISTGAIDAAAIAANAIGASELAADAATEVAAAVWDKLRADHVIQGSFGEAYVPAVSGNAITGTLSTTQMTTDLTEATDDHYNGKLVCWITGALKGQVSQITDYVGATKRLDYTAVTEAPANGDDFIIF